MMMERSRPGDFEAVQELFCGHLIHTGKALNVFRVAKGQLTTCPEGCGDQKTKHVRSGKRMPPSEIWISL